MRVFGVAPRRPFPQESILISTYAGVYTTRERQGGLSGRVDTIR